MRRPLLAVALVLMLGAACASDGDGAGTATTAEATSTTTEASSRPTAVPTDCPEQPDSGAGSPAPDQGSTLSDGMFFGYVTALDAEDLKVTFDAAQLLTGEAAARAAAEDGGEASDYWSRNTSRATRTLALGEDAVLCVSQPDDSVRNRKVTLVQLNQSLGDGEPMAVWIDVRDGVVLRVQQQYFP